MPASYRRYTVVDELCGYDADVVCLQEMTPQSFAFMQTRMHAEGYDAEFGKLEGDVGGQRELAILWKRNRLVPIAHTGWRLSTLLEDDRSGGKSGGGENDGQSGGKSGRINGGGGRSQCGDGGGGGGGAGSTTAVSVEAGHVGGSGEADEVRGSGAPGSVRGSGAPGSVRGSGAPGSVRGSGEDDRQLQALREALRSSPAMDTYLRALTHVVQAAVFIEVESGRPVCVLNVHPTMKKFSEQLRAVQICLAVRKFQTWCVARLFDCDSWPVNRNPMSPCPHDPMTP
jgi:hypothetical protein